MARTRKDSLHLESSSAQTRKSKDPPFRKKYLHYKRHGFEDPGDYCPECGEPTGFQNGFLVCHDCGWIDSGPDAIEINFNAA